MIELSGSVARAFSSGSPYARLYGGPPFGFRSCPGCRPRASSAARAAASNRAFAGSPPDAPPADATPPATHRPEPPRPGTRPRSRRSRPPGVTAPRSRLPAAVPPPVSSALRGSRSHAVPSIDSRAATQLLRQTHHLHEQRLEVLQVPRRNSHSVRCCGKLPAANTRNATSSSSARAIPRDENSPSRRRRAAPSPSSEGHTARCADRLPRTGRRTPSDPDRPPDR